LTQHVTYIHNKQIFNTDSNNFIVPLLPRLQISLTLSPVKTVTVHIQQQMIHYLHIYYEIFQNMKNDK